MAMQPWPSELQAVSAVQAVLAVQRANSSGVLVQVQVQVQV